jgi:mannitol/fructose-specific phosphotransferase system IIA component (Ntr-type)
MLEAYLTADVIKLNLEVEDWEGAVRAGGQLLLEANKCTPAYIDAMVCTVKEMGPYMVLAPGLALAHARPEDGVKDVGLSLVTLKTPVNFGSAANDPVELVISFCAVNRESHVDVLKELALFLRDEDHQHLLREARTIDEVLGALTPRDKEF